MADISPRKVIAMQNTELAPKQAFIVRLLVGILFGLGLAYLAQTPEVKDGAAPIRAPLWEVIATAGLFFGAFVIWAGAGTMRRISLLVWAIAAIILVGVINAHEYHQSMGNNHFSPFRHGPWLFPLMFIAHELASSGDIARKWVANYETYFDEAWKRGAQLILALVFTGVTFGILALGATLVDMIGFRWFKGLLENEYFTIPVAGAAMAISVHLGDVQPKLLANVRALALSVLAWLLLVIVVVAIIFVVSLAFSGLAPLWATKAATASLLGGCVFLVLLMNAAYGRGEDEKPIPFALKIALRAASILLLIFAVLAGYSLMLRINQYGLTNDRVFALVGVIISVLFGLFYVAANFSKANFMDGIERANIAMAFVKVFVFIALLTPIADPNRLSVGSQIGRLKANKVSIEKFDWNFLRFDSGRYGENALAKLVSDKDPKIVAAALKAKNLKEHERLPYVSEENDSSVRSFKPNNNYKLVTKGANTLPQSFMETQFKEDDYFIPNCLKTDLPRRKTDGALVNAETCPVALIDLNHDGKTEIIFLNNTELKILKEAKNGWGPLSVNIHQLSQGEIQAFNNGEIIAQKAQYDDLKISGKTFAIEVFGPQE